MRIRVATFNVENLFERPLAMNLADWQEGAPYLKAVGRLNDLFNHDVYTPEIKVEMLALLEEQKLATTRPNNRFIQFQRIRGQLFKKGPASRTAIVANGRQDWVGWVELKRSTLDGGAIRNTARVIAEVNPDLLIVVEVEGRPALQRFHDSVLVPELRARGAAQQHRCMVIEGNDPRGIDIGLLTTGKIVRMRSHVFDEDAEGLVFSRDCPEYEVEFGRGRRLTVLPNHFTSKGSDPDGSRRARQARQVKAIYESLRGPRPRVIVAGDLNEPPADGHLAPLLAQTDLMDAMDPRLGRYHGPSPGTFQTAAASQKLDYLLFSPALQSAVAEVDVNRRGYFAPRKWQAFPELNAQNKDLLQASDHHCVWADLEI